MTAGAVPAGTALDDGAAEREEAHRAAVQRRTMGTLVAMQAAGNAAIASVVAVSSLLAADLLGGETLAGLGAAMFTAGAALVAVPLAQHMRRRGRRPGLVMAYATAVVGAGLATTAGQVGSFPLFVVGLFLIGAGQAANLVGRYVAADLALPDRRARAISIVVWTGTLSAVLGPAFATHEKDAAGSASFNRSSDRSSSRARTSSSPPWSSPCSCGRIRSWSPEDSPRRASRGCGGPRRSGAHSR